MMWRWANKQIVHRVATVKLATPAFSKQYFHSGRRSVDVRMPSVWHWDSGGVGSGRGCAAGGQPTIGHAAGTGSPDNS
jgi:hypothetical protein